MSEYPPKLCFLFSIQSNRFLYGIPCVLSVGPSGPRHLSSSPFLFFPYSNPLPQKYMQRKFRSWSPHLRKNMGHLSHIVSSAIFSTPASFIFLYGWVKFPCVLYVQHFQCSIIYDGRLGSSVIFISAAHYTKAQWFPGCTDFWRCFTCSSRRPWFFIILWDPLANKIKGGSCPDDSEGKTTSCRAWRPEFKHWAPHSERRKQTPSSRPLTFNHVAECAYNKQTNKQTNK